MNKKILMILADGFEEIEALGVADFLRRCEFTVILSGLNQVAVTGSHDIRITADTTLAATKPSEFDALILPGGTPGSQYLYDSNAVLAAVQSAYQSGRIVAAICAAPIVLARAGLLVNRTFTANPAAEKGLSGAKPTGKMVECDGRIITAKAPGATFAFAAKIAAALGAEDVAKKTAAAMFLTL